GPQDHSTNTVGIITLHCNNNSWCFSNPSRKVSTCYCRQDCIYIMKIFFDSQILPAFWPQTQNFLSLQRPVLRAQPEQLSFELSIPLAYVEAPGFSDLQIQFHQIQVKFQRRVTGGKALLKSFEHFPSEGQAHRA